MKNLKMTIFSDNKLSIRSYSTINKFIVVRICLD